MFEAALRYYPGLGLILNERLDPLFVMLRGQTQLSAEALYSVVQVVLLILGSLYLSSRRQVPHVRAISEGILCVCIILFISGLDPFLSRVQWLPFVLGALIHAERSPIGFAVLLISLGFWVITAGTLATFGCAVFLLLAMLRLKADTAENPARLVPLVIVFVTLGVSILTCPEYPLRGYPGNAQLTSLSLLSTLTPPLIGTTPTPSTVNFWELKEFTVGYVARYFWVLFLALFVVVLDHGANRAVFIKSLVLGLLALGLVGADLVASPQSMVNTPFQALARYVPGLSHSYLPWVVVPFAAILTLPLLVASFTTAGNATLLVLIVVSQVVFVIPEHRFSRAFAPDRFSPSQGEFVERTELLRLASTNLIKDHGSWVLDSAARARVAQYVPLMLGIDFQWTLSAVPTTGEVRELADGDLSTRWRTARAQQPGDHVVVTFDRTILLGRVDLNLGANVADFPRGLQLEGSSDGYGFELLYRSSSGNGASWNGPVKWSPNGSPYYGSQSDVSVIFPNLHPVRVLRISQIGSDPVYDWSINELRLFGAPTKSSDFEIAPAAAVVNSPVIKRSAAKPSAQATTVKRKK